MTAKEKEELLLRMDERLGTVLQLATKTNGRVTALEKWKNILVGGGLVVSVIIGWLAQRG